MADIAELRTRLLARLADMESRIARIEADLSAPHSADSEDQAIERELDQALEGQDELLMHEIAMIQAALARIDAGSYGECTRCGESISPKRIEAIPETPLCIACATELQCH